MDGHKRPLLCQGSGSPESLGKGEKYALLGWQNCCLKKVHSLEVENYVIVLYLVDFLSSLRALKRQNSQLALKDGPKW